MSDIPQHLTYASTHEWVIVGDDDTATVGISDHAQSQLGDLVFVELPETGIEVHSGDDVVVVESFKTSSDVYSPLSGTIIATNDSLSDAPEQVNQSPYEQGWLYRIKLSNKSELDKLLNATEYQTQIDSV